ncbi:MAG: DUF3048 domain-containing protein [Ruminococcaceae bacterium]|nr:DUF3048 domain-containing protein [Oscillospiraceae bacterium]
MSEYITRKENTMSDKELDEILNEIKNRSKSEDNNTADTFSFDTPKEEVKPVERTVTPTAKTTDFGINDDAFLTNRHSDSERITYSDESREDKPKKKSKSKKPLVIIVSAVILLAILIGVYFGVVAKKGDATNPTVPLPATEVFTKDEKRGAINPLTGEDGYNEAALTKRPVAVVVENEYSTESVRPQWGMNKADIVLEGESEYSTRTLLFFADYTNVPSQVGPARSARPPFIRFSQLFDSIFIHAGLSKSKGDYVGADSVFESDNVDHVNLLSYAEDGKIFGRDYSRTSTVEHTGYLNGENVPELIESNKFNTTIDTSKFSILEFNNEVQDLSSTKATSVHFTWSDVYSSGKCPKVGKFYYDTDSKKYTTEDFDSSYGEADLRFENLIFLLDETEYVVKENYKGSGKGETYCNYNLSGGEGKILSNGTAVDIKWSVENKKLVLKTTDGKAVKLNPGKSYIGYGSSNHGGKIEINPSDND